MLAGLGREGGQIRGRRSEGTEQRHSFTNRRELAVAGEQTKLTKILISIWRGNEVAVAVSVSAVAVSSATTPHPTSARQSLEADATNLDMCRSRSLSRRRRLCPPPAPAASFCDFMNESFLG